MTDGSFWKIKRDKPCLKKGAIPFIVSIKSEDDLVKNENNEQVITSKNIVSHDLHQASSTVEPSLQFSSENNVNAILPEATSSQEFYEKKESYQN